MGGVSIFGNYCKEILGGGSDKKFPQRKNQLLLYTKNQIQKTKYKNPNTKNQIQKTKYKKPYKKFPQQNFQL